MTAYHFYFVSMKNNQDNRRAIAEHLVSVMLKKEPMPKEAFEEWIKENPTANDVLNELTDEVRLNDELQNFSTIDKQESARRMLQKIAIRRRRMNIMKVISVAAAIATVSLLIWQYVPSNEKPIFENEIANAKPSGVRLIINDKEEVYLSKDTIESHTLKFSKTGENEVAYTVIGNSMITTNRLVVPSEEKFTIYLSDGTKVLLNAQSELIFPSEFPEDKREVTIHGEALFEVAKESKRPFIVHCDTIAIQVYGTTFNVSNRKSFSSFLCEGSIGVSVNNQPHQMLSPNQLITIDHGVSCIETVTNGDKYIDWTTGFFIFDADTIDDVIEELTVWYNTPLIVEKHNRQIAITGSFEHSLKLEDIINSIEEVTGVKLYKK